MNFQVLKNFIVNTPQGEKMLRAGQIISLSKDKAKPLIDQNKLKGMQALTWETLACIHIGAGKELAKEGLNLRLQSREITAAEDRLNEVWRLCLKGELILDDFKTINRQWADSVRAANEKVRKVGLF